MADKKLVTQVRKRQIAQNMLKGLEKFREEYNASDTNAIHEVPIRLEMIERCKTDFESTISKVAELDADLKPDVLEPLYVEDMEFFTRYCKVKGFLLSLIKQDPPDTQLSNTSIMLGNTMCSNNQGNPHLRLPKVDLPVFDGNSTKWLTFRDRFVSMIHGSSDIPAVMKLQYLLSSLKGEAAQHFEHTTITEDNYAITWSALKQRYDDKRNLVREYFRALQCIPVMNNECVNDLAHVVDEFIRHVKGLKRLGEPVESWDTPLTNMIFAKLDDATLLAWEIHSSTSESDKYNELIDFLQARVKILKSRIRHQPPRTSGPVKVAGERSGYKHRPTKGLVAAHAHSQPRACKCSMCEEDHPIYKCSRFAAASVQERYSIVMANKLCFNCLHAGHTIQGCRSKVMCNKCSRRHHSMLCRGKKEDTTDSQSSTTASVAVTCQSATVPSRPIQCNEMTVFLSTIQVWVTDHQGRRILARGLLDSGSQTHMMSEKLAQQLSLPCTPANVPIAGVGGVQTKVKHKMSATLSSQHSEFEVSLTFLIIKKPTADLPRTNVDISTWQIPKHINLADLTFNKVGRIDFILGAEVFFDLILEGRIALADNKPTLIDTKFGWIISGSNHFTASRDEIVCAATIVEEDERIDGLLETFFRVEDIVDQDMLSSEERECEQFYEQTTTRDVDGRYTVRLPLKCAPSEVLGSSRSIALRRFLAVERRLGREPETRRAYVSFMQEYEELGHMSKIATTPNEETGYYLPHHPVFKNESTTTKCRVVYDASCKTESGQSLNDIMKVGPTIQEDAASILIRFRTYPVALIGDVKMMYRQVLMHEQDRCLQKILWRESPLEPICEFTLNTVTYGTAAAPFLAVRTLKQVMTDHQAEFPLAASHFKDFYVDDLISGERDEETVQMLRKEVKELYAKGGFQVRKWASNHPAVLADVEAENLAIPIGEASSTKSVMTLGLVWEPRSDMLRIKVHVEAGYDKCTKRTVLSCIAKIHDPVGIIDPIKATAKQIMQKVWNLRKEDGSRWKWDEELPRELKEEWKNFYDQLRVLEELRIPRFVMVKQHQEIQMHIFCDASEKGYGACCYIRTCNADNVVGTTLLTSRSKVAPLSVKHTIARLELCGAHLASKLYKAVSASLNYTESVWFWTDSTTVLHWLNSPPNTWKTFVANRVSKIQQVTKIDQWRHVPGIYNPADLVSRGIQPSAILGEERWWHGPEWLKQSEKFWPRSSLSTPQCETAVCERQSTTVCVTVKGEPHRIFLLYSSYSKLRRIVAAWMRYFKKLQGKPTEGVWLSTDDLREADRSLCRLAQRDFFQAEIDDLKKGKKVSNTSSMKWLSPILHSDGVIRVGGRLGNSSRHHDAKHPAIIHSDHVFARLLAQHYHQTLLHAGPQLMNCVMRNKYWIVGARQVTRKVFHECVKCFRCKPIPLEQPMSDLPAERVNQVRPFSITGVDYCGPIYVKGAHRRAVPRKAFVSVFVCFVTRAVHLELVSDLSTAAFIAALKRFVSRRGLVSEIHSDNGTNFKGAAHELNGIYKLLKSKEHQQSLYSWTTENEINWKFIPPRAPHFGGLWEAAVRSFKHHLIRVMAESSMTFEDLSTLLAEIEACLNSRPITQMTDDPTSYEALTPGHFLVGSHLRTVPEINMTDIPENRLNHWHIIQQRLQHFWKRWHIEYLQQLQSRRKWVKNKIDISPGMLVVVKEDNIRPSRWPLGRIVKIHPGKDGVVRVVTIRTATQQEVVRPIAKICLIPSN